MKRSYKAYEFDPLPPEGGDWPRWWAEPDSEQHRTMRQHAENARDAPQPKMRVLKKGPTND